MAHADGVDNDKIPDDMSSEFDDNLSLDYENIPNAPIDELISNGMTFN